MASHYAALQGRFMLALDIQHVRMKQHATDKARSVAMSSRYLGRRPIGYTLIIFMG